MFVNTGSAIAVEAKLAELDNKLMASVLDGLDIEESGEFKLRAESALESLRPRLSEEEAGKALTRLVRQMVRRSKQMPLLSLFSPEADSNPVD